MLILIVAIAFYPAEMSSDKPRYVSMYYLSIFDVESYEYRDRGWIIYNYLCGKLFGNSIDLFFLLTSIIYVGGFYLIGKALFSKRYLLYFLVMSAGCLGFSNYGTNVIRSGVAISLLFWASSMKTKAIYKLLMVLVALSFHKSVIIPIVAYFGAKYIKRTWIPFVFWCLCLTLSAANFDLSPLFEEFGFVDDRVGSYVESMDEVGGNYDKGFRTDFLLYSIVPLILAFFFTKMKDYSDVFYSKIIRTYLFANAVWLLAIRMEFSDRLAYLSWFLIPLIVLYPVINYPQKFKHPQHIILFVMYLFMGTRLILSLRHSL